MSAYRLFANCFLVFCVLIGYPLAISAAEQDYWRDAGVVRIGDKKSVKAPDFVLSTLDGRKVSLKDFRGKAVFLNFWATWCPPCVVEMPSMEKLHKEFRDDGLVILAINFRETPEQAKAFVKKHKLTFTVLLDLEGSVFELYQAWALPVTTIVNKRREIGGRAMGSRDWDSKESQGFF